MPIKRLMGPDLELRTTPGLPPQITISTDSVDRMSDRVLQSGLTFPAHIPVLFGQGRRLFEGLPAAQIELERTRVLEGEGGVTHLHYRVVPRA